MAEGEIASVGVKLTLDARDFRAGMRDAKQSADDFNTSLGKAAQGTAQLKAGGGKSTTKSSAAQNMGVDVSLNVSDASIRTLRSQIQKGLQNIPITVTTQGGGGWGGGGIAPAAAAVAATTGLTRQQSERTIVQSGNRNYGSSGWSGRKLASGGPVAARQGVLVGELRPEVFVPKTPGIIEPSIQQFYRTQEISRQREMQTVLAEEMAQRQHQARLGAIIGRRPAVQLPRPQRPAGAPSSLVRKYRDSDWYNPAGSPVDPGWYNWGGAPAGAQSIIPRTDYPRAREERMAGGPVRPASRGVKPGSSWNLVRDKMQGDKGYVYHGTDHLNLISGSPNPNSIQPHGRSGVLPNTPSGHFWPEKDAPMVSWWSQNPRPDYGNRMLRTRMTDDFREFDSSHIVSPNRVPRNRLQYYGEDGSWHRLRRRIKKAWRGATHDAYRATIGAEGPVRDTQDLIRLAAPMSDQRGATVPTAGGRPPSRGYSVGIGKEIGAETEFADIGDPVSFMRAFHKQKRAGSPYVGTWIPENDTKIWVDPVAVSPRQRWADQIARAGGELAYYDLGAGEEIPTSKKQLRTSAARIKELINRKRMAGGAVSHAMSGKFKALAGLDWKTQDWRQDFGPEMVPTSHLLRYRHIDREVIPGPGGGRWYMDWLTKQIDEQGFDPSQPLTLGYQPLHHRGLLQDGNHRLAAAMRLGIPELPTQLSVNQNFTSPVGAYRKWKTLPGASITTPDENYYVPKNLPPSWVGFNREHSPDVYANYEKRLKSVQQSRMAGGPAHAMGGRIGKGAVEQRMSRRQRSYTGNLRDVAGQLTPEHLEAGRAWYREAQDFVQQTASDTGYPPQIVGGLLAALSANSEWGGNKTKVLRMLGGTRYNPAFNPHKKATGILDSYAADPSYNPWDVLGHTPKTGQFYKNVMGDLDALTVDLWAARSATRWGMLDSPHSGPARRGMESAYRKVAGEMDMAPAEFQAAAWIFEKERAALARHGEGPGFVKTGVKRVAELAKKMAGGPARAMAGAGGLLGRMNAAKAAQTSPKLRLPGPTGEELARIAGEEFGYTEDPVKAAWVSPVGKYLDFSAGGPSRWLGHAAAKSMFPKAGPFDAYEAMMERGWTRLGAFSPGNFFAAETQLPLTAAQMRRFSTDVRDYDIPRVDLDWTNNAGRRRSLTEVEFGQRRIGSMMQELNKIAAAPDHTMREAEQRSLAEVLKSRGYMAGGIVGAMGGKKGLRKGSGRGDWGISPGKSRTGYSDFGLGGFTVGGKFVGRKGTTMNARLDRDLVGAPITPEAAEVMGNEMGDEAWQKLFGKRMNTYMQHVKRTGLITEAMPAWEDQMSDDLDINLGWRWDMPYPGKPRKMSVGGFAKYLKPGWMPEERATKFLSGKRQLEHFFSIDPVVRDAAMYATSRHPSTVALQEIVPLDIDGTSMKSTIAKSQATLGMIGAHNHPYRQDVQERLGYQPVLPSSKDLYTSMRLGWEQGRIHTGSEQFRWNVSENLLDELARTPGKSVDQYWTTLNKDIAKATRAFSSPGEFLEAMLGYPSESGLTSQSGWFIPSVDRLREAGASRGDFYDTITDAMGKRGLHAKKMVDGGFAKRMSSYDPAFAEAEFTDPAYQKDGVYPLSVSQLHGFQSEQFKNLRSWESAGYMKGLRNSMSLEGVQNPVDIRVRADGTAMVYDGNHRIIAAQDLGREHIPATVRRDGGKPYRHIPEMFGINRWVPKRAGGGSGALDGVYLVGEIGPELFVPNSMAGMIPKKVMDQIPRAKGGMQVIGKRYDQDLGGELFFPPTDGVIVPNRLMDQVPRAADGIRDPELRLQTFQEGGRFSKSTKIGDGGALPVIVQNTPLAVVVQGPSSPPPGARALPPGYGGADDGPLANPPSRAASASPRQTAAGPTSDQQERLDRAAREEQLGKTFAPVLKAEHGEKEKMYAGLFDEADARDAAREAKEEMYAGMFDELEARGSSSGPPNYSAGPATGSTSDIRQQRMLEQWMGGGRSATGAPLGSTTATPPPAATSAGGRGAGGGRALATTPEAPPPPVTGEDMAFAESLMGSFRQRETELYSAGAATSTRTPQGMMAMIAANFGGGQAKAQARVREQRDAMRGLEKATTNVLKVESGVGAEGEQRAGPTLLREYTKTLDDLSLARDDEKGKIQSTIDTMEKGTPALKEWREANEKNNEVIKKSLPGTKDSILNLGKVVVGIQAYSMIMQGVGTAFSAARPVVADIVDEMRGFASISDMTTTALAKQNQQSQGNLEALFNQQAIGTMAGGPLADFVSGNLATETAVKTGASNMAAIEDYLKAVQGQAGDGRLPKGTFGGYGGPLESSFMGQSGFWEAFSASVGRTGGAMPDLNASVNATVGDLSPEDIDLEALQELLYASTEPEAGEGRGRFGTTPGHYGAILAGGTGLDEDEIPGGLRKFAMEQFKAQPRLADEYFETTGQTVSPATVDFGRTAGEDEAFQALADYIGETVQRGSEAPLISDAFRAGDVEFISTEDADMIATGVENAVTGEMKNVARAGIVAIDKVTGEVATPEQYKRAGVSAAVGAGVQDPRAWAKEAARVMNEQWNAADIMGEFQMDTMIPYQLSTALTQQPLIDPAAGISMEGASRGAQRRARASMGDTRSRQAELGLVSLDEETGRYEFGQDSIAARGQSQMADLIAEQFKGEGGTQSQAFIDWDTATQGAMELSMEIGDLTTSMQEAQKEAQDASFANQFRLANRALSDARGLVGDIGGSRLGYLQREQYLTGRASQSLGLAAQRLGLASQKISLVSQELSLALQARQIATNLAVAQFQAPGETGEERYARQREAIIRAGIERRQLGYSQQQHGISKQQFGISEEQLGFATKQFQLAGEIWAVNARRAATDAERSLEVLQISRDASVKQLTAQRKMAVAQQKLGQYLQAAANVAQRAERRKNDYTTATSQGAISLGKTFNDLSREIRKALDILQGGDGKSTATGRRNKSGNPAGTGPTAAGRLSTFLGATEMTVGEAGTETVAVLRNPRTSMVNMGGGGGGGPTNVNINISDVKVRSGEDIERLATMVTRKVEQAMSRKGQMLGLRKPSY